jgi:hypothetical protein
LASAPDQCHVQNATQLRNQPPPTVAVPVVEASQVKGRR